ncbi:hypothetical protein [Pyxidicoccus trucidator]|uniref:hypothetical protein n=1 Tax=Pyxidicoccus trucidator TaxID=2709662 RepID=UPI0013D9A1F0|nr:hypothetical protein [Pyxidicoccus trucidator]
MAAAVLALTGCDGDSGAPAGCVPECPTGYACTEGNTCTGGSPQALVLDVKAVEVAGTLLREGAPIQDTNCSHVTPPYAGELVSNSFLELRNGDTRYYVNVGCESGQGWTFQGWVPPGAYAVTFQPDRLSTERERHDYDWHTRLLAWEDRKDLVIDVGHGSEFFQKQGLPEARKPTGTRAFVQQGLVEVSGTLTRNGQPMSPFDECGHVVVRRGNPTGSTYVPPNVVFIDEAGISTRVQLRCGDSTSESEGWTFSGFVAPGTYRVELELDHPLLEPTPSSIGHYTQFTSTVLSQVPGPIYVLAERLQLP